MLIPPKYTLNPKISELLSSVEASREVIDSISIPPEIELNIRRQSSLRSSLFSARIEGNELSMDDLSSPSRTQAKAEVFNTLKAMNAIAIKSKKDINLNDIFLLHKIAMEGLVTPDNLGKFRREMSATFNKAGIAIYMHPPPHLLPAQMKRLIKYINSSHERFIPIKAALAHYTFEKIHPFLDGNGRVGRLLVQKILTQGGYGMKGLLAFEEYIDNNRPLYYRSLEEPEKDVTDYLIFMLESIEVTAKKAKEEVLRKQKTDRADYLLPRRAEIYRIIRDLKTVNFDQIKRRFAKVNERTLRYDLKKLQDGGFIRKLGSTKGVYYQMVG